MKWPKFKLPGWTDVLIYAGALANISLWIVSGEMVESGNVWARLSSIALGVVMSFGPVQIIQKWAQLSPTLERKKRGQADADIRPNPRYWLAVGAFGVILAAETLLLAPVVMAMMKAKPLPVVLGAAVGWWSAGRVLVSAIAMAGLSAVLGAHAPKSDTAQPEKPQKSEIVQEKPAQPVAVPAQSGPARRMVRCTEPNCGMEYAWPNGKGAHYKKHHAPVPVDPGLLIKR